MIETMLRCRADDPKRNNVFSLYDIYGHVLAQNIPFSGVMKFTIWIDSFFVLITMQLVCLNSCSRKEKKISKKFIHFHNTNYMATS